MADIKGILFDKDGTLVDFEKTWFALADLMALHAAEGQQGFGFPALSPMPFSASTHVIGSSGKSHMSGLGDAEEWGGVGIKD